MIIKVVFYYIVYCLSLYDIYFQYPSADISLEIQFWIFPWLAVKWGQECSPENNKKIWLISWKFVCQETLNTSRPNPPLSYIRIWKNLDKTMLVLHKISFFENLGDFLETYTSRIESNRIKSNQIIRLLNCRIGLKDKE